MKSVFSRVDWGCCGLCGGDLMNDLDRDTGVCTHCVDAL